MPEPPNESEDDVKYVLVKLYEDVLHVNTTQNTMLGGCHRFPRHTDPYNQGRARDIVMRFIHFPDRIEIFPGTKTLQGYERKLYINEQFRHRD